MRRVTVPLLSARVRWTLALAVAAVVFYVSVIDPAPLARPDQVPTLRSLWDKQLHFVAYAAVATALAYATAGTGRDRARRLALSAGGATAYGGAIELVQSALPYRYFGAGDLLANALGASLIAVWFVVETRVEFAPVGERSAG